MVRQGPSNCIVGLAGARSKRGTWMHMKRNAHECTWMHMNAHESSRPLRKGTQKSMHREDAASHNCARVHECTCMITRAQLMMASLFNRFDMTTAHSSSYVTGRRCREQRWQALRETRQHKKVSGINGFARSPEACDASGMIISSADLLSYWRSPPGTRKLGEVSSPECDFATKRSRCDGQKGSVSEVHK